MESERENECSTKVVGADGAEYVRDERRQPRQPLVLVH